MILVLMPLALFLVCGAVQGALAAHGKGEVSRAFLGLLPLAGFAVVVCTVLGYEDAAGWDQIAWFFYFFWAVGAFAGTLLGWLTGFLVRRRRKKRESA